MLGSTMLLKITDMMSITQETANLRRGLCET